jgi:hypothetical protein
MTSTLDQLPKRTQVLARSQLAEDEEVVAVLAGRSKQAMIVTDRQVLIVKPGWMAGAALGTKAGSFPFGVITAINVHTGRGIAALEIVSAAGPPSAKPDLRTAFQLPNWLPCDPSLGRSPVIAELRSYVRSGGRARSARAELSGFEPSPRLH